MGENTAEDWTRKMCNEQRFCKGWFKQTSNIGSITDSFNMNQSKLGNKSGSIWYSSHPAMTSRKSLNLIRLTLPDSHFCMSTSCKDRKIGTNFLFVVGKCKERKRRQFAQE